MKVRGGHPGSKHGPIKFPPMTSSHSSPEERTMVALTFGRVGMRAPRPPSAASSAETRRSARSSRYRAAPGSKVTAVFTGSSVI